MLEKAERWLFIGYSLPDADFEFLHMLKCVQKQTNLKREIIAVMKHDSAAEKKYSSLFGKQNVSVFNDGLDNFVKCYLS